MAKTKTALQAASAGLDEKKRTKTARSVLASLGALLGLSGDNAQPHAGKMRKVTETHKHVKTEEEEGGSTGGSSEEEEESMSGGSESESSESTGMSTGSSDGGSKSEEEEEESAKGKPEEEEEKAVAKAVAAAYRSPAVQAAFLAALPKAHRDVGALYSPHRLASATRKATGAKTTAAAMSALSTFQKTSRGAEAAVIQKVAKVETKVRKLGAQARTQRVNAIVEVAKAGGKASSHELRAQLREYGAKNGTAALTALVATLPAVRTDSPRRPKADESGAPIGVPAASEQAKIVDVLFAGMAPEARAKADADLKERLNGRASTDVPRS